MDSGEASYSTSITIATVLAGFSFTAMLGVMAVSESDSPATFAFNSFLIATFSFLISAIAGWATLEWIAERKNEDYEKTTFFPLSFLGFFVGLAAFLTGVTATAFSFSLLSGVLSISGGVALVLILAIAMKESARSENTDPRLHKD